MYLSSSEQIMEDMEKTLGDCKYINFSLYDCFSSEVKNPPTTEKTTPETQVECLGQEDPLE